jgi:ferredoxin--NADP+ reductase
MTSEKFLPAKILDRRAVADDLFLLHVDPGGPFSYLAGQYATLGVEVEGERIERAYSLCSSPYENVLEFFVERIPNGELTPLLYAMDKGAPLFLRRFAKGRFTLDLLSGRKNHLLLATVTGVAPYVSYIRTVRADWKKGGTPMPGEHRLFCIQGASRSWEFGYRDELEKYAAEAPWGLTPEDTSAYLCGHPGMVESGRGILLRAGWSKQAIQDEVYFQPGKDAAAS